MVSACFGKLGKPASSSGVVVHGGSSAAHEISWARILVFSKLRGAPVFDRYEYPSALCRTEQCFVTDTLHDADRGRHVKTPRSPHCHLADVSASLFYAEGLRTETMSPVLKTLNLTSCFSRSPWESEPVHATHLPRPMPCSLNLRHLHPQIKLDLIPGLTDTGRINPVGFRIALLSAVELSPTHRTRTISVTPKVLSVAPMA